MRIFDELGLTLEYGGGVATWSYEGKQLWQGSAQSQRDEEIIRGLDDALDKASSDMWGSRRFIDAAFSAVQTFDPMRAVFVTV